MSASACSLLAEPQKWQDQAEETADEALTVKAGGPEFDMAESCYGMAFSNPYAGASGQRSALVVW